MRRITFCNNCGKNGHLYYQCKKPIISAGIILFKKKPTIQFLLICRKDSLGYVDFMRGKYNVYNPSYIQNLIDEMTETEKENIVSETFEKLWSDLWGSLDINQYTAEEIDELQFPTGEVIWNLTEEVLQVWLGTRWEYLSTPETSGLSATATLGTIQVVASGDITVEIS